MLPIPTHLSVLFEHLHAVEGDIMRVQKEIYSALHQPHKPVLIAHSKLTLRVNFHQVCQVSYQFVSPHKLPLLFA